MINLEKISFSYGSTFPTILRNCSCSFRSAGLSLILGENGSGKSTLMDMMSGFKRPQQGRVIINRVDMYRTLSNVVALRKIISYMPSALKLPPYLDVAYITGLWMGSYRSQEILEVLELQKMMGYKYLHLSDGYKTRIHLAIALSRGSIVLVDEPLKSQDEGLFKMFPTLLDICAKGRTIIVSSPIPIEGIKWDAVLRLKEGDLV